MSRHGRQKIPHTLSPRPRPPTADITPSPSHTRKLSTHRHDSVLPPPTSPHDGKRGLRATPRPSFKVEPNNEDRLDFLPTHSPTTSTSIALRNKRKPQTATHHSVKAKASNKSRPEPSSELLPKATLLPCKKMVSKSAMKPPKKTGRRPPKGNVSKASKPTAVTKGVPPPSNSSLPVQKLTLKFNNHGNNARTTKSGREVKQKQDLNSITGDEYNDTMQIDSSSPPHAPSLTSTYTPAPRIPLPKIVDPPYKHHSDHYPADIDNSIFQLADTLLHAPEVQVELPDLEDDNNPDAYKAWTAKQLVHLYLICYHREQWNGCDLIADTWIRALQKTNARRNMKGKMWKSNQATNYNPFTSRDYADVEDPILEASVSNFDQDRINELFFHTNKKCGARFLWADAMALCGSDIEDKLEKAEPLTGRSWHKELVWEIMKTSLRLVRVRLTLKIEEKTPGEWCRRYHEHGRNRRGLPCYRDLRRDQDLAKENEVVDGGAVRLAGHGKRKAAQLDRRTVEGEESNSDEDAEEETNDAYAPRKRVNFQDPKLAWDVHQEEVVSEEE